jgi:heptose-I-phosphate ethanolaminephosphotransferase
LFSFISKIAFSVACLVLLLFDIIFLHVSFKWGGGQFDSRAEAYLESPSSETIEYLRSHIAVDDVLLLVLATLIAFLLIRTLLKYRSNSPAIHRLSYAAFSIWGGVFFAAGLHQTIRNFEPVAMVREFREAKSRLALIDERRNYLTAAELRSIQCNDRYDKIVIVLGESMVTDHMSAFGYSKRTTPFIDNSDPYKFLALSPSNQTRYALPMMLTDAQPADFDRFYRSPSLVSQLRSCGYETLWVSNQGRVGRQDNLPSSMAREADRQYFLNTLDFGDATHDGRIPEVLLKEKIYSKIRTATFIHLIGSHVDYRARYPDGFGFANIEGTVDEYDNSILFTDHVLKILFENFGSESLLFVYVSDHGQVVSSEVFGQGYYPSYKNEYRIPLLIWSQDDESMEQISRLVKGKTINAKSFDDIIRFLVGMDDSLNISTSEVVSSLVPDQLVNYSELEWFNADQ